MNLKSRSSPRVSDSLYDKVTQHDYFGLPGEIFCMAVDISDNTIFLFTESALYTVSPSGTTALLSGDEHSNGFADGCRALARFSGPRGMALDREKKLMYVADTGNHVVRIIQLRSGYVQTVAGRGEEHGFLDGVGDAARFSTPVSIVLSSNDSIYVCDKKNHALRRVVLGGHEENPFGPFMGVPLPAVVTTLCGGTMYGLRARAYVGGSFLPALHTIKLDGARDGPCNVALFYNPMSIALDSHNNIIVADYGNSMIRSVNPASGITTTLVGMHSSRSWVHGRWHCDGSSDVAIINHPTSVCVDEFNNIIVADCNNNQLRLIRSCGTVLTLAGGSTHRADGRPPPHQHAVDGRGATVRFNQPQQVMLDHRGVLHVVEKSNEFWTRRLSYDARPSESNAAGSASG